MGVAANEMRALQLRLYSALQATKLDGIGPVLREQDFYTRKSRTLLSSLGALASLEVPETDEITYPHGQQPDGSGDDMETSYSSQSPVREYEVQSHGEANVLRMNAAIMFEVGLIAEQLENAIVDIREQTPSANLGNSTLEAT